MKITYCNTGRYAECVFSWFLISYPLVYIILTLNQTPLEKKLSLSIGNNVFNQSPSVRDLR